MELDLGTLLQNSGYQIQEDDNDEEDNIFDELVEVIPAVPNNLENDNQDAGLIHNSPLPSPIPATAPMSVTTNRNDISVNYEGIKKMKWRKLNYVSQPHQLQFHEEALPQAIQNLSETIEFLQLYPTSQFMNDLAFQANLYARQQGKLNINITPTQLH